jgi:hypothetical protein
VNKLDGKYVVKCDLVIFLDSPGTYFKQNIQSVAGRNPIFAKNIEAGFIKGKSLTLDHDLFAYRNLWNIRGIARTS